MLQDFGSLNLFYQRVGPRDAGVGDDDIEVVDPVLLLELLHDVEGVLLDRSVVLDHDQTATLALGQVGKRLGGRMARVTIGGDDSLLWYLASLYTTAHGSDGKPTWFGCARKRLTSPWPKPRFPPVTRTKVGAIMREKMREC